MQRRRILAYVAGTGLFLLACLVPVLLGRDRVWLAMVGMLLASSAFGYGMYLQLRYGFRRPPHADEQVRFAPPRER